MSDSTNQPKATPMRPEMLFIGIFAVLCLAVLWFFSSQQQQQLRGSATGLDGLQVWLSSEGHDANSFAGGWTIDADTIGLLVMPLYDTDLGEDRVAPQTKEELIFQQDEYDLDRFGIGRRADLVQTMAVLPKWRTGLRLTGLGHPALLVDRTAAQNTLQDVAGVSVGKLRHIPRPFNDFAYTAIDGTRLTARLYVAQVFDGNGCAPIIGDVGEMVLGWCTSGGGADILVLSDPDLFSNHGLRLGDNAMIAADLLPSLAQDGKILIDYSRSVWITEDSQVVARDRTWADLKRFFEFPFSVLWLGGAILMLIVLWRAGLRYGPIGMPQSKLGASKLQAIAARARLMRLTGQDGALLSDYVAARITAVSSAIFGAAYPGAAAKEAAYLKYIARSDPAQAENLSTLLAEIRSLPPQISSTQAITYVNAFERTLEQLAHDT